MNNIDLDIAKALEQTSIKKQQRRTEKVELKLDYLYNCISALAKFMKYSRKVYNNEKITKNIKAK